MIRPHGGSGLATLLRMDMPENSRAFEADPEGEESYPIVLRTALPAHAE
jgi:hypothetical protein